MNAEENTNEERKICRVISDKQAEKAREFTKSALCTTAINLEIQDTTIRVKIRACNDVDTILKEYALPFDKSFPSILGSFLPIATRANIDPASLYCIYMEYQK